MILPSSRVSLSLMSLKRWMNTRKKCTEAEPLSPHRTCDINNLECNFKCICLWEIYGCRWFVCKRYSVWDARGLTQNTSKKVTWRTVQNGFASLLSLLLWNEELSTSASIPMLEPTKLAGVQEIKKTLRWWPGAENKFWRDFFFSCEMTHEGRPAWTWSMIVDWMYHVENESIRA